MIRLGVIGYGVRADMLMDELLTLPGEACLCAVADRNPERVKALMTKKGSKEALHSCNRRVFRAWFMGIYD